MTDGVVERVPVRCGERVLLRLASELNDAVWLAVLVLDTANDLVSLSVTIFVTDIDCDSCEIVGV